MAKLEKFYRPSDSEVERFHASDSPVRGIRGPFGSGKSVCCFWEIFFRAQEMPAQADGVRRSKWAVVRNTYPELLTTSLATYSEWFGGCSVIRKAPPIEAVLKAPLQDGTRVELHVLFLALDRPDDVKKLLSLELTGAFLNETRELPLAILNAARGRVGRYPSLSSLPEPYWSGVIMDTNPPDDDHWWYDLAEVKRPDGFQFFSQAPALVKLSCGDYIVNPDAEYVRVQPKGARYWLDLVPGSTEEWIKVYVLGQYGTVMDGKPVYPEYRDDLHCSKENLEWYKGQPLILGWDFGLTPACIMMQVSPKGQVRIIDELVSEDMGIRQFAAEVVKPHLANHYPKASIQSYGDPAGSQRAQTDERTCMDELKAAGLDTSPAPTNEFVARRESVATPMLRTIDGEPGFLLSPKCRMLRRGFLGGYKYERVKVSGEERYKDQPAKNRFSHPHDGLQYGCLAVDRPAARSSSKAIPFKAKRW